jgi:hypothetical protein
MKKLLILIFIFSQGYLFSQKSYPEKYSPQNIFDAVAYMDYKWTEEEKEKFKSKDENGATLELHFGYGMWLRNSWLRNGNPKLPEYFYKKKVFAMDDMSNIILTVFHRKLNNKKFELNKIFKPYKTKWRIEKPQRKSYRDSINKMLDGYKINDTLTWKYYTTVIGVSPEETEKFGDCRPKAIILKKSKKNKNFFVKLISSCDGKGIEVGVYGENYGINTIEINKTGWTSYWEWEPK